MSAEHSSEEGGKGLCPNVPDGSQARCGCKPFGGLCPVLFSPDDASDLRASRDRWRDLAAKAMDARDDHRARAESAEAERDDLRGRLAAVERLADGPFDPTRRELRAALANPSAAQDEGEAAARALREAAEALNTEDAATDVALLGVDYVIRRLLDRADALSHAPEADQ